MEIRTENPEDQLSIKRLNDLAFGQTDESQLIEKLRNSTAFIPKLSLVAEEDGKLIGHILFSKITIAGKHSDHPSLALAPMSVLPEYQNRGIGSKLVDYGLAEAKRLKYTSVVVLGHPKYYPRFGFRPADQFNIHPPHAEWKKAFFALELNSGNLDGVQGTVVYPPEFGI